MKTDRYLNGSPVSWLLDGADPSIRYLTLRDIIRADFAALEPEYEAMTRSDAVSGIIDRSSGGILGDRAGFDTFYSGTMWHFAAAVYHGLDTREKMIKDTADYILENYQLGSGGFTLNWKPRVEDACATGDMIRYLMLAGIDDERIGRGIEWIKSRQRHDGGWLHSPINGVGEMIGLFLFRKSGRGALRENDGNVESCIYASAACLSALALYNKIHKINDDSIAQASEFFLRKRMFISADARSCSVSYKRYWNRDYSRPGVPILSQYDILSGLALAANAGKISDPRCGSAFNLLISKQDTDGIWSLESAETGMLYGGSGRKVPIGERSRHVTLRAVRLLIDAGLYEYGRDD
jgi:hypothetical protein